LGWGFSISVVFFLYGMANEGLRRIDEVSNGLEALQASVKGLQVRAGQNLRLRKRLELAAKPGSAARRVFVYLFDLRTK
jgi:hypothetical protein